MHKGISRRQFSELLAMGLALPYTLPLQAAGPPAFRIRTITASVIFDRQVDFKLMESTANFLQEARHKFEAEGYEVQTLRMATQPVTDYLPDCLSDESLEKLQMLDSLASQSGSLFSIGPVISDDAFPADFPAWAAQLIQSTKSTSFSANIASRKAGLHGQTFG